MSKVVVLDVVGLTRSLITERDTPFIYDRCQQGSRDIANAFPALTCVSQATFLTGKSPAEHGIVANGFYDHSTKEVRNWHQSRSLVQSSRIYDSIKAQNPNAVTFANCAWHSMYDDAIDIMITPRPQYMKDGRKFADVYTKPDYLRDQLQTELGTFPLHNFWGPFSNLNSSKWIVNASKRIELQFNPDFSFIYLPHLDYVLQHYGPNCGDRLSKELRSIDDLVRDAVQFYEDRNAQVVILSEYGIMPVDTPIHINRILNEAGYLSLRRERNGQTLDYGASRAFALSDHQIALVHISKQSDIGPIKALLKTVLDIEFVFDQDDAPDWAQSMFHRERCGQLVCIAKSSAWFTYYFWLHDRDAPDYAATVAIHEKPGYDPCELLVAYPDYLGEWFGYLNLFVKAILSQICRLRVLVNATPITDRAARTIAGSHGRLDHHMAPIMISTHFADRAQSVIQATDVFGILLSLMFKTRDDHETVIEA